MQPQPHQQASFRGPALVAGLCLALLTHLAAPAAPRRLVAYVIVNGSARGLQLFGSPGVAINKNRDLNARGIISRAPGDATPLFTGAIAGSPATQLPVVELDLQRPYLQTLSQGIVRVLSADRALTVRIRDAQAELLAAHTALEAAAAQLQASGIDPGVIHTAGEQLAAARDKVAVAVQSLDQLPPRPSAEDLSRLHLRISQALTASQIPFDTLKTLGLPSGFDICVQDDRKKKNALAWSSFSGNYQFICNGQLFTGRGTVQRTANGFALLHEVEGRRIEGAIDTTTRTGSGSLETPVGTARCTLADKNYTNSVCP